MNSLALHGSFALPALVGTSGERAITRFLEFFASTIRNPHTLSRCSIWDLAQQMWSRRRWGGAAGAVRLLAMNHKPDWSPSPGIRVLAVDRQEQATVDAPDPVSLKVAAAVATCIFENGLASVDRPANVEAFIASKAYYPTYPGLA